MNRDSILERPLPSAPDAERAILGSLILDNALIDQAALMLDTDIGSDFYVPSHRHIFMAMLALYRVGMEITPILIAEELNRENALESAGGVLFLTNLTYGLPHVTSIASYA